MELECKTERNSLIKLLRRFKELMQNVLSSDEVDLNNFESYTTLRKFYEETERKLLDPDYFHCMLGKNFDDKCPPLEDDEDRDL